ncbi:MAG: UDP-N-acetylmuramoyl-tripeptide--D-alanyl-D-alanine ligase, partial [Nitrospiraceae bacterium]
MSLFTVGEVVEITSASVRAGQDPRRSRVGIRRVCTDSRDVRSGDLFVALKGERYDGHQFVEAALRRGAVAAVVENRSGITSVTESPASGGPVLLAVPDTLLAYQQLAAHHRQRFRIPLVAVTGSNGKTTTKDMVANVLSERWTVLKTEGNLNNRIGVPQTLLRVRARHQAAVVEMGVDQKGQTTRLAEIARPTIGLITNIGPDHLEFFGTVEASAQAKGELLDLLPADGAAVLNADDAHFGYLASRTRCRVVSFGLSRSAEVRATDVVADPRCGTAFRLTLPGGGRHARVILRAHGAHNLSNALAAAAVGHCLALGGAAIARGLARFRPATMRSQVSRWGDIRIINDCYNANPASMKAAIDLLVQLG